tara:strand:- start:320 stop:556 length:237 start_codon:yes stop_codon:yes gene_type:complete
MSRKSKYTGGFRPRKYESRIPFPYVVFDEKKEVYFRIVSGFPSTLAVTPIMKEHFPDDYKGYIASSKCWDEIKHLQKK